jgi:hypothetical protein
MTVKKIYAKHLPRFLLAKLHTESLARKNTIKAIRQALQHLPKDLQETYDEAMQRIDHQSSEDRELALLALTWVANAKRPLSVSELREALAIELESTSLDVDNFLDIDIILSACVGLIIVDDTVSVVCLIHYTTQEYFDNIQPDRFPFAQTTIVNTCLTYLSFEEFEKLPETWDGKERLVTNHPFLGYAQYCLMHAKGLPETHLQARLLDFLLNAEKWTGVWHDGVPWADSYVIETLGEEQDMPPYLNLPIWMAASCNLEALTRHLLVEEISLETKAMAPQGAASHGLVQMVELLADKGANVSTPEKYYEDALQAASAGGHELVVRFLIEKGADVNAQGGYYGNALQAAAQEGYEPIVKLLIEKGADVNAQGGE